MRRSPLAAGALTAGLILSACGGGGEATTTAQPAAAEGGSGEAASSGSASEQASANSGALQSTDDARTTEILNIADGSITSLQQAVTGDRPVLLWFWAPH